MDGYQYISFTHSWLTWRKATNRFKDVIDNPYTMSVDDYYEKHSDQDGMCEICHGAGVIVDPNVGRLFCLCKVIQHLSDAVKDYSAAQIGYERKSMDDLDDRGLKPLKDAIKIVNKFIEYPTQWLLMMGSYGSGKSHMLQSIASEFGPMAAYLTTGDFGQKLSFHTKINAVSDLIEVLSVVPILIIDDLGSEHDRDYQNAILRQVIDNRYRRWQEFPTVVSTNMNFTELRAKDPRVASRLMDKDKIDIVALFGVSDYRTRVA